MDDSVDKMVIGTAIFIVTLIVIALIQDHFPRRRK